MVAGEKDQGHHDTNGSMAPWVRHGQEGLKASGASGVVGVVERRRDCETRATSTEERQRPGRGARAATSGQRDGRPYAGQLDWDADLGPQESFSEASGEKGGCRGAG